MMPKAAALEEAAVTTKIMNDILVELASIGKSPGSVLELLENKTTRELLVFCSGVEIYNMIDIAVRATLATREGVAVVRAQVRQESEDRVARYRASA
jgi:hypothetical protein